MTVPMLLPLVLLSGCLSLGTRLAKGIAKEASKPSPKTLEYERPVPPVRTDHPRLMADAAGADALLRKWQMLLIARGEETLKKPPIVYQKALLVRSREAVARITLLAGLYRTTGDRKWGEGARKELLNVCAFRDWAPGDFLATGEMLTAVGLGYDWAYDALSPADRKLVQTAIVSKGLTPALTAYSSHGGWTTAHHNWNLVCNGGVIVASLAILDEQPKPAAQSLSYALKSIRNGIDAFDAHGGTAEGPMYHNYAIKYLVYAASCLQTAVKQPVSLSSGNSNWLNAGDYRIAMTGNSGKVANFGDGVDVMGSPNWMLWLAQNADRPQYVPFVTAADADGPNIFDYLWYTPALNSRRAAALSRAAAGSDAMAFESVVTLRSPANASHDTFLAARVGSNAGNHTHLDLGSVIIDIDGQRFAHDLGADNYDLPGYLGDRRADYLRSSTPGHNTLSVGNASQPNDATATCEPGPKGRSPAVTEIDLRNAYPDAKRITRTVSVDAAGSVIVDDAFQFADRASITWNLHTPAKVTPTKDGWLLESNGRRVRVACKVPGGAKFSAAPDATDPPELPVEGSTHLRIKLPTAEKGEIRVVFTPE